jgi:hypothetical protein
MCKPLSQGGVTVSNGVKTSVTTPRQDTGVMVSSPIYRDDPVTLRPRFTLTLQAEPGPWPPAEVRLKRLLKCILRAYGFRATSIREEQTKPNLLDACRDVIRKERES